MAEVAQFRPVTETAEQHIANARGALSTAREHLNRAEKSFDAGDIHDAELEASQAANDAASAYGWLQDVRRGRVPTAAEVAAREAAASKLVVEWSTNLRAAQPGWLFEQDCLGVREVDGRDESYCVVKAGVVVACEEFVLVVEVPARDGGRPERWRLGYADKARVRAPESDAARG